MFGIVSVAVSIASLSSAPPAFDWCAGGAVNRANAARCASLWVGPLLHSSSHLCDIDVGWQKLEDHNHHDKWKPNDAMEDERES